MSKRKNHAPEFKARRISAALCGEKIVAELSAEFGIHQTFSINGGSSSRSRLPVFFPVATKPKRAKRQGVCRASTPKSANSPGNIIFSRNPGAAASISRRSSMVVSGSTQGRDYLALSVDGVGGKCVRRLMCMMGLTVVCRKPKNCIPHPEHTHYPYLPQGLSITRPDQVWVFIECFWQLLKYENASLHAYETGYEARARLGRFITGSLYSSFGSQHRSVATNKAETSP